MREFQLNAPQLLNQLPISLTRYGRVVAVVQPPELDKKVAEVVDKLKTLKKIDPAPLGMVKKEVTYVEPQKVNFHDKIVAGTKFRVCPHENESGQCPQGCVEET